MVKTITFLIQNFSRGAGSERATALIADRLADRGYSVNIVSICGDNTSYYEIDIRIKLYTMIDRMNVDNKRFFLKVYKRLKNFFEQHKTDLVIDVFAAMSVYTNLLKKKYNIKNITWEHYNYLSNMGVYKYCRKNAIRYSDYIITLTDTDKQYYIKNDPSCSDKIDHIFNPSPFQNVVVQNDKREDIVLAVGRLIPLKGFDHLIHIWKYIEERNKQWKLVIVGDGPERQHLEDQIIDDRLQNVVLYGPTRNVECFYSRAKIYVSTSDREGLPMTMIEAQSFGLPIVSYDYETGPKDIISDHIDGYIVYDDEQEKKNVFMAEKILFLMEDQGQWERFSMNARQNAKRFSIPLIEEKWIQTIENVIGQGAE